jgi:hypothetical protein
MARAFRHRDPQAEASPRLGPLLDGTPAAEHLETEPPRGRDAIEPDRVSAIDSTVGRSERWMIDVQSDEALRNEIAARVGRLVIDLSAAHPGETGG